MKKFQPALFDLGAVPGDPGRRRELDDAMVFHAQHVQPRIEHLRAVRKALVRSLQPFPRTVGLPG